MMDVVLKMEYRKMECDVVEFGVLVVVVLRFIVLA